MKNPEDFYGEGQNQRGGSMTRAALYARVSTSEQATKGISVDAQLDSLRTSCNLKGWDIADEYVDRGHSGKDGNRPDFQRLMLDATRDRFDVVTVTKLDRFMRDIRLMLNYLDKLDQMGISFVSSKESIDTSNRATGRLTLNIMASIAEFERERIGERVKDARIKLIENKRWPAGRPVSRQPN